MVHSPPPKGNSVDRNPFALPSLSLPKGGGAVRGLGEKVEVNAVNGTASTTDPIPTSPA